MKSKDFKKRLELCCQVNCFPLCESKKVPAGFVNQIRGMEALHKSTTIKNLLLAGVDPSNVQS